MELKNCKIVFHVNGWIIFCKNTNDSIAQLLVVRKKKSHVMPTIRNPNQLTEIFKAEMAITEYFGIITTDGACYTFLAELQPD